MVQVTVDQNRVVIMMQGIGEELASLHHEVTVPLSQVTGISADPSLDVATVPGWKVAGTDLPGELKAGVFRHNGEDIFLYVNNNDQTVSITLAAGAPYAEIVVEVEDPQATVELVQQALAGRSPS